MADVRASQDSSTGGNKSETLGSQSSHDSPHWPSPRDDRPHDDRHPFYAFKSKHGWKKGKPFKIPQTDFMKTYLAPPSSFIELTNDSVRNFVFVTGASSNHFNESIDALIRAQRYFPKKKIFYYDLGLNESERLKVWLHVFQFLQMHIRIVSFQVRTWCSVELRTFNFSQFPMHVRNLKTYAFKPIIMKVSKLIVFKTPTPVLFITTIL